MAGGFDRSLDRAQQIGASCLMTFASSPRSLSHAAIPAESISRYLAKKKSSGLGPHFFHGVYLVNLASSSHDYLQASIASLISYQQFAGQIGGIGTIFHIGSTRGPVTVELISQIVEAVNYVTDSSPKGTKLILENSAGQSGSIGSDLGQLGSIIGRVGDHSKIGVCLDTQHLFAAGIDLQKSLNIFDRQIGLKYLTVLHINDSETAFGSHIDRHANLGEGKIGLDNLRQLLADPRIAAIPLILEVPGENKSGPRRQDIDTLKSLIDN